VLTHVTMKACEKLREFVEKRSFNPISFLGAALLSVQCLDHVAMKACEKLRSEIPGGFCVASVAKSSPEQVCCSVLQCVARRCRVLQDIAGCCRVFVLRLLPSCRPSRCVAVCCSVLQCVAVCCSVLRGVAWC